MKATLYVTLTLLKAVIVFYYATQILKNLYTAFKKKDEIAKHKALKYFILMFALLIGISALEFGIGFLLHVE